MPLNPRIAAALRAAQSLPSYESLPIEAARAQVKRGYPARVPPIAVGAVTDRSIPGPAGELPVRIYAPEGNGPWPLVMFFHGSGFVLLDLDSHDDICRRLCRGTRAVVVSVDYRLAPEHPFPAAPDDCFAATEWAAANAASLGADANRIGVAGDSAGACLAIATALRWPDAHRAPLAAQLLFYPVTDHYSSAHESHSMFAEGFGLSSHGMRWFWDLYLPSASAVEAASPLRAASFAGLPATCVMVAECDVLRDEGELFAKRLSEVGVPVELTRWDGLNHGFLKWIEEIDTVTRAFDSACIWLRKQLDA